MRTRDNRYQVGGGLQSSTLIAEPGRDRSSSGPLVIMVSDSLAIVQERIWFLAENYTQSNDYTPKIEVHTAAAVPFFPVYCSCRFHLSNEYGVLRDVVFFSDARETRCAYVHATMTLRIYDTVKRNTLDSTGSCIENR